MMQNTFTHFFFKFAPAGKNLPKVEFTWVEYYVSQRFTVLSNGRWPWMRNWT